MITNRWIKAIREPNFSIMRKSGVKTYPNNLALPLLCSKEKYTLARFLFCLKIFKIYQE
jgi:hypothetical protein